MINYKTVSLRSPKLSKNQRDFYPKRVKVLSSMPKIDLVSEGLNNLKKHKENELHKKNWQLDFIKTGTPYLGDAFFS